MQGSSLAFVVTGFVVGIAAGLLGIGGAVILVPALIFVFKFSQVQAQGTTLGALVPPIGIFAALAYWRAGNLDVRVATLIACGFVFGALAGATAVPHVSQVVLRRVFATILVYTAFQMMFKDSKTKLGAVLPGVVAAAVMWLVYLVRKRFAPTVKPPPPSPPPPGDVYHI